MADKKAPYKMKGSPMQRNFGVGSPMRKDEFKAVKSTDKGAKSTILPTVNVSAKKLKTKHTISKDKETGEKVYTKSKGSKSTEYVENPKYKKDGAPGPNNKWIRRDGAADQYGPIGFN